MTGILHFPSNFVSYKNNIFHINWIILLTLLSVFFHFDRLISIASSLQRVCFYCFTSCNIGQTGDSCDKCDKTTFVCSAQQCLADLNTHMSNEHRPHVQETIATVAPAVQQLPDAAVLRGVVRPKQKRQRGIEMIESGNDTNPYKKKYRKE